MLWICIGEQMGCASGIYFQSMDKPHYIGISQAGYLPVSDCCLRAENSTNWSQIKCIFPDTDVLEIETFYLTCFRVKTEFTKATKPSTVNLKLQMHQQQRQQKSLLKPLPGLKSQQMTQRHEPTTPPPLTVSAYTTQRSLLSNNNQVCFPCIVANLSYRWQWLPVWMLTSH